MNITLCDLLTLIFITLKLCHQINWPWILVVLPFLIPFIWPFSRLILQLIKSWRLK